VSVWRTSRFLSEGGQAMRAQVGIANESDQVT